MDVVGLIAEPPLTENYSHPSKEASRFMTIKEVEQAVRPNTLWFMK